MKNPEALSILIIGGVAGGASAAARARRLAESAKITVLERGPDVSFANCGLPYHIGGEIADRSRLALQTPQSLKAMLNVDVRARTEAVSIDRTRRLVRTRNLETGAEEDLPYDKLILAPGAAPLRPPLPGVDDPRVHVLRNLQDMDRIKAAAGGAQRVAIIGAGFIGLEMAEQLHHLGKTVSLVELLPQVLPQMDPEMVRPAEDQLRTKGIDLVLGDGLEAFDAAPTGLSVRLKSGRTIPADLVILSIGVRPEAALAKAAGLELGARGHVVTNPYMQTSDPDIYAVGDVTQGTDPVLGGPSAVPLGGPANRQGRVAADHIFLGTRARPYPGSIGTAIVRVFDVAAGVTGWTEKRLAQAGVAFDKVTVTDYNHAGYYPGAVQLTLKLLWRRDDGRVLGAQATGPDGVDKRLDVLATAIRAGMTIDDLCHLELSYAPPFGSAKDLVNLAGFAACNARDGLVKLAHELPKPQDTVQLLDLRPAPMAEAAPFPGAQNIPLAALRDNLDKIDRTRPVLTLCALGKTSYFGARVLAEHGFDVTSLSGGLRVHAKPAPQTTPTKPPMTTPTSTTACCTAATNAPATACCTAPAPAALKVDATGLACPGPIMKLKDALGTLQPGQELEAVASDSGFSRDVAAFAAAQGLELLGVASERGIVRARLRKGAAPATAASHAPAKPASGATLVVFSCELDRVLASLVIANGAAAMGGPVTLFFTFWGLNALRRDNPGPMKGKTLMDRMFGWMMPRGADRLPLSRMHMGGLGTALMKYRMRSKSLPNVHGLLESARASGVRLVACSMSMDAMGLQQGDLIDGVEIGGVADFLGAASKTPANLFV